MKVKSIIPRLLALLLVVVVGLVGCTSSPTGLTGNYTEDTIAVVEKLTTAIDLPDDAPNRQEVQEQARDAINDYISRYRKDDKNSGLRSFTTMQTALNSLAGYYNSFGARPLPNNLKERVKQEFRQVELALKRNA